MEEERGGWQNILNCHRSKLLVMSKIILDLCGGTGAWSKPYKEAGYEVFIVTTPTNDVRSFQSDFAFHSVEGTKYINPKDVYGILAAPPCTMFSLARRNAKLPPDYRTALNVVEACERIIRACCITGNLKFWAMENPRGKLRYFLGVPKYTFYQWMFGGQHKKPTDLWGYFNKPIQTVDIEPEFDIDKAWQKPAAPAEYQHLKLKREAIRAITPSGFAEAFFKANP